jgi:hypothetical protein
MLNTEIEVKVEIGEYWTVWLGKDITFHHVLENLEDSEDGIVLTWDELIALVQKHRDNQLHEEKP